MPPRTTRIRTTGFQASSGRNARESLVCPAYFFLILPRADSSIHCTDAASSSSPSSARQSSSFSSPFGNTKFLPYDRPSSPLLQFPASDDAHRLATTKDTFFATASDDIDETKFSLSSPLDAAPPQLPVATAPVVVLPTIPERTIIGTDGERLNLRLGLGQRVRFGRKVKTKSIASRSQTDGKDAQDDDATTRELITIRLPKSAKYASRLHCTLHAVPLLSSTPSSPSSTGSSRLSTRNGDTVQNCTLIVKVLGQNGMKIDGVVFATGTEKRISSVGASATKVELDFWGWGMSIILGGGSPVSKSNLRQLQQSVVGAKDEAMSSEDDSDEEDIDRGIIARRVSSKGATASTSIPKQQRDDSPALSVLSSLSSSSPIVESVPLPSARNINANKRRRPSVSSLSSSSSSSHHDDNDDETASATHSRALALVESLSLDLQGLIASAIVFHHRSTVGVEEVIRALLKDVGGMWAILKNDESRFKSSRRDVFMSSVDGGSDDEDRREKKEEEAVDAWWDCIEDVLSGNKMFGCIGNVGLTVRLQTVSFSPRLLRDDSSFRVDDRPVDFREC